MNIEFECARKLVTKFCSAPKSFGNEIKIAYKLLYDSPDLEAWDALVLPKSINSLSFFLTENGRIFIPSSARNPYLLDLDKLQPKTKNKIDLEVN